MTTELKIRLTRWISCAVLLLLAIGLIILSENARTRAIVTTNPSLEYEYSDDELIMDSLPQDEGYDIFAMIRDSDKKYDIDDGFLNFCSENENIDPMGMFMSMCLAWVENLGYDDEMWEGLTGYTFSVLYDLYTGAALSGGDDGINVIGDVYTTRKTVISLMGEGYGGIIPDGIGILADADLTLFTDGSETFDETKYYISGGLKFAVVYLDGGAFAKDKITEAKSVSDVVIAIIRNGTSTEIPTSELAESGADLIVFSDGDGMLEYVASDVVSVPVINGIYGKGEGAAYMTLSLTVGVKPILRYFPLSADGEPLDEEAMLAEIAARNPRFTTAVIADDNKVRER